MTLCPCCHQPMHTFEQPALLANRPPRRMAECHNRACALWMQTTAVDDVAALAANVSGYERAAAREQAVRA